LSAFVPKCPISIPTPGVPSLSWDSCSYLALVIWTEDLVFFLLRTGLRAYAG